MKAKGTRDVAWTEDEIRRVAEMRARNTSVALIALQLGRTIHSVKGFLSRCAMLREQGIHDYSPRDPSRGPAQQTLEDRSNRILASQRMSTTAFLMHDPPPGYSALDRMRQRTEVIIDDMPIGFEHTAPRG